MRAVRSACRALDIVRPLWSLAVYQSSSCTASVTEQHACSRAMHECSQNDHAMNDLSARAAATVAALSRSTSRKCLATSMAMTPAEQPMPARLWESMSERILKWLTIIDAREGVGEKQEHTAIRMSICTCTQCHCGAVVWQAHKGPCTIFSKQHVNKRARPNTNIAKTYNRHGMATKSDCWCCRQGESFSLGEERMARGHQASHLLRLVAGLLEQLVD